MLVKDNREAMAMAICAVDTNVESYRSYADAAYERYIKIFSGEAITWRLDETMKQGV